MHLKERTADSAVYLLSGQLPLVADLHKRILGTLGSVLRSSSIEIEIAERQIILKLLRFPLCLSRNTLAGRVHQPALALGHVDATLGVS